MASVYQNAVYRVPDTVLPAGVATDEPMSRILLCVLGIGGDLLQSGGQFVAVVVAHGRLDGGQGAVFTGRSRR